MAQSGIEIAVGNLARTRALLNNLSSAQVSRATQRAIATLKRRMVPEASRLISEKVLNLRPRQISQYMTAQVTADGMILRGSNKRLPLSMFDARWGGRKTAGAEATLWRGAGSRTFAHTFKIRGKKQVYQRKPGAKRFPIVVSKGPRFSSAVILRKHGDIYPELLAFSRDTLAAEIQRLLTIEAAR